MPPLLTEMSLGELQVELLEATSALMAAEYQERLSDFERLRGNAQLRKQQVVAEIDARLAALDVRKQETGI